MQTRRDFLRYSLAGAAGVLAAPMASGAEPASFSFVLLGDLHFDRLEHHDMGWLEKNKGGDLSQIRNYTRITAEIMPQLFATVRETVAELNRTKATRVAFVLQVGDLVEGLCGTAELAARQNTEALAFVREAGLGVPFLFTKGNHDVTGDGAPAAFAEVFHPFQREQRAAFTPVGETAGANYALEHGGAQFCFFDAYTTDSLDWLEAALAKRTAAHCFVAIHPPVVPYGARATWYLYSGAKDRARREKLIALLGRQNVFVLGGHIHKFNTLLRATPGGGRFAQLAMSSVINAADPTAKDLLTGVADYNGDQIRVEPKHSPETEPQRRAVYEEERAFVKDFAYADLPGYAVVTVSGASVQAQIFSGTTRKLWRSVDLTKLLAG